MSGFKLELGSKVKCKITGFEGVVIGRTEWLHGCRRYSVQPTELKDGKPIDPVGFDEDALEIVKQAAPHVMKESGGPGREPSRAPSSTRSR